MRRSTTTTAYEEFGHRMRNIHHSVSSIPDITQLPLRETELKTYVDNRRLGRPSLQSVELPLLKASVNLRVQ